MKPTYEELERRVQELKESEIYYRTLFENVNDAVLVHEIGFDGKPGKFIDANRVALKRLGCTHDELLKLTPKDIVTENGYKDLSEARANITSNCAAIFETTHLARNGSPIPVESHVRVVDLAGQRVAVSVVRDLSERKQAEEDLRRFKIFSDNAVYGKAIADLQGNLLYVNQFFANIHGYEPEQLIEKHLSVFHSQEQMEAVNRLNASMVREGQYTPTTVWHRHQDGTDFPMLMSGILIKDDYGNPQCIAVSAIDMTAHHKVNESLQESEQKHRRLFETMAQGVVYHSADGVIISANPAAERILGLSFEQMQGKTSMDPRWKMILEDGTTVPGTEHPAMIAMRNGQKVAPVIRGVFHSDKNAYVWLSITAIPLFQSGETKPFQVYATFEDITERKEAQEALQKSRDRIEAIFAALDDAIILVDPSTRQVIECNKATSKIFGYPYEQILGKDTRFMHVDQEHFEKAKNHSGSIDLLMTDVVMPEMNGRDLAGQISDLYPDIKLLFMSGYTADVIAHQGILDKRVAFIQKPFSMADMTEKVRDVLDEAKNPAQG